MRRFVIYIIIILLCILLAFWSPWLYFKINILDLFGVTKPTSQSGLDVFSLSGEVEVFLDNQTQGKITVERSPLIVSKVVPGDHLVTIKRIGGTNSYWTFSRIINFVGGADVVVSYELGPTKEFSEGQVIYPIVKTDPNQSSQVVLTTNANNAQIVIDKSIPSSVVGTSFIQSISLSGQHVIKVSAKGFESLQFTVLPSTQDERDKLKQFNINIDSQLMYQPIPIL